jgi:nucleoside-diphosphate-sugar epimerase
MTTPANILITGSQGLIGRYAAEELRQKGHEVHGVSRQSKEQSTMKLHQANLLNPHDREALIKAVKPDIILHLAWETEHGTFWNAQSNLDWVSATLHLAQLAAKYGCKRFVGAGTCVEYTPTLSEPASEADSPTAPHTLYGTAKLATFNLLKGYFKSTDTSFAWGRIFMPYGDDEHPDRLVSSIARALVADNPAPIGPGTAIRDFIHVEDVGRALASLAVSQAEGAVNIGSGEAVSIKDIALKLGEIGKKPDLIKIGALPAREGEPAFLVANTNRLHYEIGFVPLYDLNSGLASALRFWQEKAKACLEKVGTGFSKKDTR